jgi:hypothetical protein
MLNPEHTSFPRAVFTIAIFVLAASLLFWVAETPLQSLRVKDASFKKQLTGKSRIPIPHGIQTYQIVQPKDVWPKIIEATINPPDVHVGDLQKLSVTVQDDAEVVSAIAFIETDNGIKELPLNLVEEPVALAPRMYGVNARNQIVFLDGGKALFGVANAAEAATYTYSGEWVVHDTHDTFYHTKFVVKDAKGRESSITLAWSDACGIPDGGAWTMSSSCTISSADGVDNGNVTLSSGTLTLNAPFGFNPGRSLTISGGSIAIGSGGQIQQTNVWISDLDGDTYRPSGATQTLQASQPAGKTRRYLMNAGTDCNDSDNSAWQNVTAWTDADGDARTVGSSQTVCGGFSVPSGYAPSPSATADCDDSNSSIWENRLYYRNADGDSRNAPGGLQSACSGVGTPAGWSGVSTADDCDDNNAAAWVTYPMIPDVDGDGRHNGGPIQYLCDDDTQPTGYAFPGADTDCNDNNASIWIYRQTGGFDSDGDGYGVPTGDEGCGFQCGGVCPAVTPLGVCSGNSLPLGYVAPGSPDCYGSNASARPGQTAYFTSDRGDGSFNYNCDCTGDPSFENEEKDVTQYTTGCGSPPACTGFSSPTPACGGTYFEDSCVDNFGVCEISGSFLNTVGCR